MCILLIGSVNAPLDHTFEGDESRTKIFGRSTLPTVPGYNRIEPGSLIPEVRYTESRTMTPLIIYEVNLNVLHSVVKRRKKLVIPLFA